MLRPVLVLGSAGAAIGLLVVGMVLSILDAPDAPTLIGSDPVDVYFQVAFGLLVVGLTGVGALVSLRRPDNPIGGLEGSSAGRGPDLCA